MNFVKIKGHDEMACAAKACSSLVVDKIKYLWDQDLMLRKKWNLCSKDTKQLAMKELCFIIEDEQIELLHPVMEEEPRCQLTFGQGSIETLSLNLKFKLTDMKVVGALRTYSPSKPCKSFPYELLLKNVEFEIMAGLVIRGDSFCIENYSHDFLNYNIILWYKNSQERKEIFPFNKTENQEIGKSIEKYIVDKLTRDIIIAVQDKIADVCIDTSVSGMLDNEYTWRNELRLHKKKVSTAFQKLVTEILGMVNTSLESKGLSQVNLPNLYGKLCNRNGEKDHFKAVDGSLQSLSSLLSLGSVAIYEDGDDIILAVFMYFSYLNIVYKNLSIHQKGSEESRLLETPDNSNSSCMKLKIHKISEDKVEISLLQYKIDDIGYIEVDWDMQVQEESYKKKIEPEVALWLNYILEYHAIPIMEDRIKSCLSTVLANEKLVDLAIHAQDLEEPYDSDPMNEEGEEDEAESDQ